MTRLPERGSPAPRSERGHRAKNAVTSKGSRVSEYHNFLDFVEREPEVKHLEVTHGRERVGAVFEFGRRHYGFDKHDELIGEFSTRAAARAAVSAAANGSLGSIKLAS